MDKQFSGSQKVNYLRYMEKHGMEAESAKRNVALVENARDESTIGIKGW